MAHKQNFLFHQEHRGESGAALLLFAALFPILMLLAGLALDMSMFYMERENIQQQLDEAALTGARFLPHSFFAQKQAEAYLKRHITVSEDDQLLISSDGSLIQLSYTRNVPSPFLFSVKNYACAFSPTPCKPSSANGLELLAISKAQINPKDTLLFFDSSSYLAPALSSNIENAWAEDIKAPIDGVRPGRLTHRFVHIDTCRAGCSSKSNRDRCIRRCEEGNLTVWPTADLFRETTGLKANALPLSPLGGGKVHRRILTQQCFNHIYSPIKELTIRLYDRFRANPSNQVGVFSGPGAGGRIVQVKPISAKNSDSRSRAANNFGNLEFHKTPFSSDEWCFATAEREKTHEGYQFPTSAGSLEASRPPSELISMEDGTLRKTLAHQISVQEAIWSRTVQHQANGSRRILDINKALLQVGNQLLGAPIHSSRGNMADSISSTAFFILGDFPHSGGQRFSASSNSSKVKKSMKQAFKQLNQFAEQQRRAATFYFVVTKHFGNYPDPTSCAINPWDYGNAEALECQPFYDDAMAFQRFLSNQSESLSSLTLIFLRVPDRSSLALDFLHHIAEVDKAAVLQR